MTKSQTRAIKWFHTCIKRGRHVERAYHKAFRLLFPTEPGSYRKLVRDYRAYVAARRAQRRLEVIKRQSTAPDVASSRKAPSRRSIVPKRRTKPTSRPRRSAARTGNPTARNTARQPKRTKREKTK